MSFSNSKTPAPGGKSPAPKKAPISIPAPVDPPKSAASSCGCQSAKPAPVAAKPTPVPAPAACCPTKPVAPQISKLSPKLTKSLDKWLEGRTYWNHQDWTALLDLLRKEGHGEAIQAQEGKDCVGLYLETHRKR